ncbi:MAG: purine-nucleoside phosphorylase, partial [Planctomycetota bacterium]
MSEDMAAYRTRVEKAASWLRERTSGFQPQYGIILGTGLGGVAKEIRDATRFPYQEIPGFPVSTSPGHSGTLHWGWLGEVPVLAFEGRLHVYEGYSPLDITLSVRVLARLGATDMVITNACGGMNRDYQKGDLLIIDDHINLLGINPLTGSNIDEWGPRFPDMSAPYHRDHIRKLEEIAQEEQIRAHTGVYVAVAGPNLETRAEY